MNSHSLFGQKKKKLYIMQSQKLSLFFFGISLFFFLLFIIVRLLFPAFIMWTTPILQNGISPREQKDVLDWITQERPRLEFKGSIVAPLWVWFVTIRGRSFTTDFFFLPLLEPSLLSWTTFTFFPHSRLTNKWHLSGMEQPHRHWSVIALFPPPKN